MTYNLTLDQCTFGTCYIKSLNVDSASKLHLIHLGFHTNSKVQIMLNNKHNLVVSVDGSKFALDKNIAKHIEVGHEE